MDDLYIKKVLDGQTEEFRYFIKHYKDLAFSVAFSVVKNEFTATEVVQESFVKAYENLKSFKGESKFSTWFCRIVINESFKTIRKEKRTVSETGIDQGADFRENPAIFEALKETEQKYYINECLNRLPANESLVLRLFYLAENSIKEIREMTGWSESNTKVHLHRGRKNMQELLQKMLNTEVKSLY
jgi:RNA polymerase sigma-70 factor (ECF subfamily)